MRKPAPFAANLTKTSRTVGEVEGHVGFHECLFQDLAPAVWALRRRLQNVIRHAGIGSRYAIENVIERNLCARRIAMLAGLDEALGLM